VHIVVDHLFTSAFGLASFLTHVHSVLTFREDAVAALAGLKQTYSRWIVEWAAPVHGDAMLQAVDKLTVFVGGLHPEETTEATLYDRFSQYGAIDEVNLVSRGLRTGSAYGFVRFQNPSHAKSAIVHENGAVLHGRRLRAHYCESQEMKLRRKQVRRMCRVCQQHRPRVVAIKPTLSDCKLPGKYTHPRIRTRRCTKIQECTSCIRCSTWRSLTRT
jgi:RNA recognition motif-containing protein